jgi:hypothetical protein
MFGCLENLICGCLVVCKNPQPVDFCLFVKTQIVDVCLFVKLQPMDVWSFVNLNQWMLSSL